MWISNRQNYCKSWSRHCENRRFKDVQNELLSKCTLQLIYSPFTSLCNFCNVIYTNDQGCVLDQVSHFKRISGGKQRDCKCFSWQQGEELTGEENQNELFLNILKRLPASSPNTQSFKFTFLKLQLERSELGLSPSLSKAAQQRMCIEASLLNIV